MSSWLVTVGGSQTIIKAKSFGSAVHKGSRQLGIALHKHRSGLEPGLFHNATAVRLVGDHG